LVFLTVFWDGLVHQFETIQNGFKGELLKGKAAPHKEQPVCSI
jgi:hypothetical protein